MAKQTTLFGLGYSKKRLADSSVLELNSEEENDTVPSKRPKLSMSLSSKHRKTSFYLGWLKSKKYKTWLDFRGEEEGMFCSLCLKYNQKGRSQSEVWIKKGCTSYREDKLHRHMKSAIHQVAVSLDLAAKEANTNGGIVGSLHTTVDMKLIAMMSCMRCMYFLLKEELPHTTLYPKLLKLARSLGCGYIDNKNVQQNVTYESEDEVQKMVSSFGDIILDRIVMEIQASPVIAVLIDETTDVAVLKQLCIYVKYLRDNKTTMTFFTLTELPDGKSETIYKAVISFFAEMNISLAEQLIAFGTDGANAMLGKHNDVAALLKQRICPSMVANHCVAHRLALASAQTAKEIEPIRQFNDLLQQIYKFYDNSAVRMAALMEIQTALNTKHLKLKQAKAVRWLSHNAASNTLRQILVPVLVSLDREASERKEVIAIGLLKRLKTWRSIAILLMMCDTLPHLATLSLCFQQAGVDLSEVKDKIDVTMDILDARLSKPGKFYETLPDVLLEVKDSGFNSKQLDVNPEELEIFKRKVYSPFLQGLIIQIKRRFPDTDLISSFKVFNPKVMPDVELHSLDNYGNEDIEALAVHFKMDEEEVMQEWHRFLPFLEKRKTKGETVADILACLANNNIHPHLQRLARICLVLPMSTADCERGFSALKRIKTCLRNRLCKKTLNNLMLVSVEGPEDPDDAFYIDAAGRWHAKGNRKINFI